MAGVERSLWAVEVPEAGEPVASPALSPAVLKGGLRSYPRCQAEAQRLRRTGATAMEAPSAALREGGARGQTVSGGLVEAEARDGRVLVLFGPRPDLHGWLCGVGRPSQRLLALVRKLRR